MITMLKDLKKEFTWAIFFSLIALVASLLISIFVFSNEDHTLIATCWLTTFSVSVVGRGIVSGLLTRTEEREKNESNAERY